ncbi:MAG: hypothetical protein ACKVJQ_03740 [Alphaproteobacteria bacterium]|jgi:hypothetical protein
MKLNIETDNMHVLGALKQCFEELGDTAALKHVNDTIHANRTPVTQLSKECIEAMPLQNLSRIFDSLEKQKLPNLFVSHGLITYGRTMGFLGDQDFLDAETMTRELLPVPNWHWNLNTGYRFMGSYLMYAPFG